MVPKKSAKRVVSNVGKDTLEASDTGYQIEGVHVDVEHTSQQTP